MPLDTIQSGNLSSVKLLQQPFVQREVVQNFRHNQAAGGERVPVVQNDILANKLDYFA